MICNNIWFVGTTKGNEEWVSIDIVLDLHTFFLAQYSPIIVELFFAHFNLFVCALGSLLFDPIFLGLNQTMMKLVDFVLSPVESYVLIVWIMSYLPPKPSF